MTDPRNVKDTWDRLTSIATILVPAAIALTGYFISDGLKQAEISSQTMLANAELASEERRSEQAHLIAEANKKIAQASLINTLIKSLTSDNPQERKLAVQAVLIALPEEGPVLVRTIAKSDEDATVQAAARASLEQRVGDLIRGLFSEDVPTRISAAQDLIQGWRNDPDVILELVEVATNSEANSNGVYNTVVVLNELSLSALRTHKEEILRFLELAKEQGPKTRAKATILSERLEGYIDHPQG